MKPAFALDFRNDAIALLHRTTAGWHQVGRVTFDDPDLPAALSYLRATALGLDPRGLATKLILPDEQVLYTSLDAPGPDDASRAAQIRAGLEGRTPYAIEDLIFDWEVQGGDVRVAVIARETLAEAEGFAVEHRFNPVSFVAAPASGYAGEPWFGLTALAPDLIGAGETVERDGEQVAVVERGSLAEALAAPVEEEPVAEEVIAEVEAAPEILTEAEDAPVDVADDTVAADTAEDVSDPVAALDADLDLQAAVDHLPEPEDVLQTDDGFEAALAAEIAAEDLPDDDGIAPNYAADPIAAPAPEYAAEPAPKPVADFRETPVFGVADDEPAPSQVFGATKADAATIPADLTPDMAAALQDIVLEEAPMAVDVEDDDAVQPQGLHAETAPASPPTTPASARVTDPSVLDDVPPVPGYTPALGFASRRASADPGPQGKAPPPVARPTVARPTAAKPLAPVAPKAERPAISRPTAAMPVAGKVSKGLRGIGALVSAPSLSNMRGKKVDIPSALAPQTARPEAAATAAAAAPTGEASLGRNIGRRPAPVRGKPKYLGLALTLLLLLVLAVIAAWSTTLAFRDTGNDAVQVAAADSEIPAAEDEMAADGVDVEALDPATLAEDPAPTEEAPQDAAPEAVTETDAAPAIPTAEGQASATQENPGAASGDEIFLAAKDQPPPPVEPVALPEVAAQSDPVPIATAPPPPFGTVYQFDANGLIVPTPEGIVTPEGVLLIAGKPPRVPAPRAAAVPEISPEIAPVVAPESAVDPAAAVPPEVVPEGLVADPALAGFRPKARPATLTGPDDDAALPSEEVPGSDSRLASLRPMPRPKAVLAAGDAARAAEAAAAASLAAPASPEPVVSTSKLAVAISRKPEPRPRDLSRAVEAAVAAAVRTPEPEPDPEPEQTASLQPKVKPKPAPEPEPEAKPEKEAAAPPKSTGRDAGLEADDEPDLPAAKVGKVSGSVAKQATFKNALNLSKTALIGVYGTPSKRYAMIRTSNGRYKKVRVGDSVDGGKVKAITASEVRYQKGSKLVTLAMPKS